MRALALIGCHKSEIGIGSDPFRPEIRGHTAGKGPRAVGLEFPVPFKCPEFLETHLAYRAICK